MKAKLFLKYQMGEKPRLRWTCTKEFEDNKIKCNVKVNKGKVKVKVSKGK